MPDHIHMLMSIPPNEKVSSSFMEYLKKYDDNIRAVCEIEIQVWG